MPLNHISRNRCFLYVCFLGLSTTILTLTLGLKPLKFLGNDPSRGDIVVKYQKLLRQNGSKAVYHKELHNNSEIVTDFEQKQIPSGNIVYTINETNDPNRLVPDTTKTAIKPPQNKPVVQNLAASVDYKDVIQESVDAKAIHLPQIISLNDPLRTHNVLDNFLTYPCIKGLPEFPPERWETDGRCVRTVNYTENARKIVPDHKCVDVRTDKGRLMPICVYPAAIDKWVSASILRGKLWESDLINKMTNFINLERQKQPDIEFLDLGSNIGCYSLYIAQEGIHVTAIDPLHENMELISKSIVLGKLQDRIRLIWNAVADHHNTVKFIPDTNNVGGTRITDINPIENKAIMDVARAITFDDLLPLFRGKHIAMKMDIEESEYPALLGGETFFQEVDVKVVQMEFQWHKKGKDGPKIVAYFSNKGFLPFKDLQRSIVLNPAQMENWPGDIYFMKPNEHSSKLEHILSQSQLQYGYRLNDLRERESLYIPSIPNAMRHRQQINEVPLIESPYFPPGSQEVVN